MNHTQIANALSGIDPKWIQEALHTAEEKVPSRSHREKPVKARSVFPLSRALKLGLAACLVLGIAASACGDNLLGLRSMWQGTGEDLQKGAENLIVTPEITTKSSDSPEPSDDKTPSSSAYITESLSDSRTMAVTVVANCGEGGLLVPVYIYPEDCAKEIGLNLDCTIGEYAAQQGLHLVRARADLTVPSEDVVIHTQQSFQRISDHEMAILVVSEHFETEADTGLCTVYAAKDGEKEEIILEQSFPLHNSEENSEGDADPSTHFYAIDPDAVPGLHVEDASVNVTELGIYVDIPLEITLEDGLAGNSSIGTFRCEELDFEYGGMVMDQGTWHILFERVSGSVEDRLTIHVYSLDESLIGTWVFAR